MTDEEHLRLLDNRWEEIKKLRLNIEKEMAAKIKEKRELEKEIKSLQEQIEDQAAAERRVLREIEK